MRYEHDCDNCCPLGEYQEFDLYYCPQSGIPTVIARFGEDGEYYSGLNFADNIPALGEARKRAIEKGLIQD